MKSRVARLFTTKHSGLCIFFLCSTVAGGTTWAVQGVSQLVCQTARVRIGTRTSNQSQAKCRFVAHKGTPDLHVAGRAGSSWNAAGHINSYRLLRFFGSLAGISQVAFGRADNLIVIHRELLPVHVHWRFSIWEFRLSAECALPMAARAEISFQNCKS